MLNVTVPWLLHNSSKTSATSHGNFGRRVRRRPIVRSPIVPSVSPSPTGQKTKQRRRRMSSMLLEVTRASHEKIERLELLIVKDLQTEPATNKDRFHQSHRVRNVIEKILESTHKLEENETPGWTQLKLPGQAPSARCGHTVTSGGHNLMLFGGHGTGGWLSRYDIYYNDCIVLDRVSVQWKRLPTSNEPPDARAYHSMTSIGSRFLLFGGFDGKSTYGDLWWLVPEEDPVAKRVTPSPPKAVSGKHGATMAQSKFLSDDKESHVGESSVSELQKRLQISVSLSNPKPTMDEMEDREFIELATQLVGGALDSKQAIRVLRERWRNALPKSIQLKELSPLLRDYQRLVTLNQKEKVEYFLQSLDPGFLRKETYRFYHVRNVEQLRMDDIPHLLAEYRQVSTAGVN